MKRAILSYLLLVSVAVSAPAQADDRGVVVSNPLIGGDLYFRSLDALVVTPDRPADGFVISLTNLSAEPITLNHVDPATGQPVSADAPFLYMEVDLGTAPLAYVAGNTFDIYGNQGAGFRVDASGPRFAAIQGWNQGPLDPGVGIQAFTFSFARDAGASLGADGVFEITFALVKPGTHLRQAPSATKCVHVLSRPSTPSFFPFAFPGGVLVGEGKGPPCFRRQASRP